MLLASFLVLKALKFFLSHTRLHLPSERNRGSAPAFLAALVMHAALIGSMWFAVQWKTSTSAPATAELWELPNVEETTPVPTPAPSARPRRR